MTADAGGIDLDAVIFDMDGLLLDTERLAWRSFTGICQQAGIQVDFKAYQQCIGTSATETRRLLAEVLGAHCPADEFINLWRRRYEAEVCQGAVPLKTGAAVLLEKLALAGTPLAVATSTTRALALLKLANAGILGYFGVITGGDEVARSKPAPEIYLHTAGMLGIPPAGCLVLEDSTNGVTAAHAAGMTVIQIPDMVPVSRATARMASAVLVSLDDVWSYLCADRPV